MTALSTRHVAAAAMCCTFLLLGCGGGLPEVDLSDQYLNKEITLSYRPSIGTTYSQLSSFSSNQDVKYGRGTLSFHMRGDRKIDVTVVGVDEDATTQVSAKYGEAHASIFRHGRELNADEAEKLLRKLTGRTLNVWIGADGELIKWGGLKGLGWGENQADLGEITANTFVTSFLVLPKKPVSLGHTWERTFEMPIKTKRGEMAIVSHQRYTLEKVVELGSHRCARISYEVLQTIEGEGESEAEGKTTFYRIDGEGEGTGVIYFDLDRGAMMRRVTQTSTEYEAATREASSNEEEFQTIHEFTKDEVKLLEKQ